MARSPTIASDAKASDNKAGRVNLRAQPVNFVEKAREETSARDVTTDYGRSLGNAALERHLNDKATRPAPLTRGVVNSDSAPQEPTTATCLATAVNETALEAEAHHAADRMVFSLAAPTAPSTPPRRAVTSYCPHCGGPRHPTKPQCQRCQKTWPQGRAAAPVIQQIRLLNDSAQEYGLAEQKIPKKTTHPDTLPFKHQPLAVDINTLSGNGSALPLPLRATLQDFFHRDLSALRVHSGPLGQRIAKQLHARAAAIGAHIVFAPGQFQPHTRDGLHLLAHEAAHVLQYQASPAGMATVALREPDCSGAASSAPVIVPDDSLDADMVFDDDTLEASGDTPLPGHDVPDEDTVDPHIEWPAACQLNWQWWQDLQLQSVTPMRSRNPDAHPKAWANATYAAQQAMYNNGILAVEGAPLRRDGILGPRTFIALFEVAVQQDHPARAEIQGLGFDFDTILNGYANWQRARALIIRPEFLLQAPIRPLGENVIRYYDSHFDMAYHDREILNHLFFGDTLPEGIRRTDRVELLRRFYGQESLRLHGTVAWVRADRDFIHRQLDLQRAVERDRRRDIDQRHWFNFIAESAEEIAELNSMFNVSETLAQAEQRLPQTRQQELAQLRADLESGAREVGQNETFALLVAVYLPEVDPAERDTITEIYLAEKAAREQAERERIESHNLGVAEERADLIIAILEDEDSSDLLREAQVEFQLRTNLRDSEYFHLVLDALAQRHKFNALFDFVEGMRNQRVHGYLMELALAGEYATHARVQQSLELINTRHGSTTGHGYSLDGGGVVFLGGNLDQRLEVGQVAGDINSFYLKDESRERLKPESQERFDQEIENQSRIYMENLLAGEEPDRSQDEIGLELMRRAWSAAGLDEDSDIEDVEVQESLRLRGLRRNVGEDGVVRFDAEYELVQRVITSDSGIDTGWQTQENTRAWRSQSAFESQLFWFHYSQTADIVETAAIVVLAAAVLIVAWEVGLIALLVEAGGGATIVSASIIISVGFYMLTHQRWTLEGILLAGLEGYLGAVGFRFFAPVGSAVAARFVLPATLTNVTMRRAVAAWLVRHGVQGALTGGAVGPAMVLAQDLLRIGTGEGGFSDIGTYLRAAGWGMLLGAVFEIGGSAILAPLFRTADATVLRSLAEVVERVRAAPEVTPSVWMAEASGALSNFRAWLQLNWDDAIANGMFTVFRDKLRQAGASYLRGARLTLHRQVLELTETQLTRAAVDGLERVIGSGLVPDNTLITLLQAVNTHPERVVPWLQFINGLDDAAFSAVIERGQLRALSESPNALNLAMRRSAREVAGLLSQRFGDVVGDLEAFATRIGAMSDDVADAVLETLRTRGTAVTPRGLIRVVDAIGSLPDDVVDGLERLMNEADSAHVDALLNALPDNELGAYLRRMRTAPDAEVVQVAEMLRDFGPESVAWSSSLPTAEAHGLLNGLSPHARTAIRDITVQQAKDFIDLIGLDTLNNALTHGELHGITGADLQRLREHFHDATVRDYLNFHATTAARMGRVARTSGALDAAADRLSAGGRVGGDTIILDSNARSAIEELMRPTNTGERLDFADLDANYQDAINAIRRQRGLAAYSDPPGEALPDLDHIVGADADLRSPFGVTTEAIVAEGLSGRPSPMLDDLLALQRARAHADYQAVISRLEAAPSVGGGKGGLDRNIIADALLADTRPGVTSAFVTTDRDIVKRLATRFADPPVPFATGPGVDIWAELVAAYPGGVFTVEILGHRLHILFR